MDLADVIDIYKPIQDYVLIERVKGAEKIGRIYLPQTVVEKNRAFEGTIRSIGPGRFDGAVRREMPDIKIGDRVLFGQYAAGESGFTDPNFWLIRAAEIIAVLDPD